LGYKIYREKFADLFHELRASYEIYAPITKKDKGMYSDTDLITYDKVESFTEIVFDKKTFFSPKEIVFPIRQTLFYFTEDSVLEPTKLEKDIVIFARACDINSFRSLDAIFLQNGPYEDPYYKKLRQRVKFILLPCDGFENCYCACLGTNITDNYSAYVDVRDDAVYCKVKDAYWKGLWSKYGEESEVEPRYVSKNENTLEIPQKINNSIFEHQMWSEYTNRCTGCGRCTVVCPTCTCFTIQDIRYDDNSKCGERRRVWASCQIDGFTEMAGGHGYRHKQGERTRFRVLHKISDFKKRFGFQMCVGCGRCEDACQEYISLKNCIHKISEIMAEEEKV